jgi:hypothetical protein
MIMPTAYGIMTLRQFGSRPGGHRPWPPGGHPATGMAARACQVDVRQAASRLPGSGLENIYGRLQVSSRTAAVLRAFPDRMA